MSSSSATQLQRLRAEQRCLDRLIKALELKGRSAARRTPAPEFYANVARMMKAASRLLQDALAEIQLHRADGSEEEQLQRALQCLLRSEVEDRGRRIELLEDTVRLLSDLSTPYCSRAWRRCSPRRN
jgi:hypothetical protein